MQLATSCTSCIFDTPEQAVAAIMIINNSKATWSLARLVTNISLNARIKEEEKIPMRLYFMNLTLKTTASRLSISLRAPDHYQRFFAIRNEINFGLKCLFNCFCCCCCCCCYSSSAYPNIEFILRACTQAVLMIHVGWGQGPSVSNCNADKITCKVQLSLAVNQMLYMISFRRGIPSRIWSIQRLKGCWTEMRLISGALNLDVREGWQIDALVVN